ncbi:hypothetical protein [Mesoflavibacter sp. CH_XMU1404-2]|uniref:hypothetical protein n=1 Tax=Mesoflavibacter sp. CH_XMU1404-2 TaxID=3107766 RepID=UPI002438B6E4
MNTKNQKILAFSILILAICIGLYKNYSDKNSLSKKGVTTTGKVIKLKHLNKSSYDLVYQFYIDSVKIEESTITSYFDISKIKNKRFKVIYLKDNPKISDIDLGKYNSYKKYRPFYTE